MTQIIERVARIWERNIKDFSVVVGFAPFDWRLLSAFRDSGSAVLIVGPVTLEVWYK